MYQCHNTHDIFFCCQLCRVTLCYETRIFWKIWAGKCPASSGARSLKFFTLTPLLLWLNVLRLPNICRFWPHSESNLNTKFNAIRFSNNVQRMAPASALRENINPCSHSLSWNFITPRDSNSGWCPLLHSCSCAVHNCGLVLPWLISNQCCHFWFFNIRSDVFR